MSKTINLKAYLKKLIQDKNLLTNPLGKSISRNMMTSTAAQVSLTTEIGVTVQLSVVIANPFRTHTANHTDPTIQQIMVHTNQSTVPGHID